MTTDNNALKIDLYELTMAAGYFHNKMDVTATFELSCHTMPPHRSYLVACGLEQIVDYLLNLKFGDGEIDFIKQIPAFKTVDPAFFEYLKNFKFTGDVWAMLEGEFFFASEPVIQVTAPIIEAQILETYLLSILNVESLIATKASRVVQTACRGKEECPVIDFGSRRAHGPQAGILAARASYIAGCEGTSNVFAGKKFGIPLYGTVAHSWIETFPTEEEAFLNYSKVFPGQTTLLIDTYDTLAAVQKIVKSFHKEELNAVRIDSGDLKILSKQVRKILDQNGFSGVKIIASGNLNEYKIQQLLKANAPIDIFGVGTDMVTSRDYPSLDLTYKLVQLETSAGEIQYKAKRSHGKQTVPGRKQVFRKVSEKGIFKEDIIGLWDEPAPAGTRALLTLVIEQGKLKKPLPALPEIRHYLKERLGALSSAYFSLTASCPGKISFSQKIRKIVEKIGLASLPITK